MVLPSLRLSIDHTQSYCHYAMCSLNISVWSAMSSTSPSACGTKDNGPRGSADQAHRNPQSDLYKIRRHELGRDDGQQAHGQGLGIWTSASSRCAPGTQFMARRCFSIFTSASRTRSKGEPC